MTEPKSKRRRTTKPRAPQRVETPPDDTPIFTGVVADLGWPVLDETVLRCEW